MNESENSEEVVVEIPNELGQEDSAENDIPESAPEDVVEDNERVVENNATTTKIDEETASTNQVESGDKQQSKDEVLTALKDWGVDEQVISTFNKLSSKIEFPQFIDQAIKLFPEAEELLTQFSEIDEQELETSDKKKEKGKAASEQFDKLADKLGIPLTESQKKVAELAFKILAIGGSGFIKWFGKGWKDSDLTRLIEAITRGADYNSAGAISKNYEKAGAENQVSADKFFKHLAENPKGNLEKISSINDKISAELNWKGGQDILQNTDGKKDNEVLRDYFLAMSDFMHKSTAENLLWEKASTLIAKEIFEKDSVIDLRVLEELNEMGKDKSMTAANNRFIAR